MRKKRFYGLNWKFYFKLLRFISEDIFVRSTETDKLLKYSGYLQDADSYGLYCKTFLRS